MSDETTVVEVEMTEIAVVLVQARGACTLRWLPHPKCCLLYTSDAADE